MSTLGSRQGGMSQASSWGAAAIALPTQHTVGQPSDICLPTRTLLCLSLS